MVCLLPISGLYRLRFDVVQPPRTERTSEKPNAIPRGALRLRRLRRTSEELRRGEDVSDDRGYSVADHLLKIDEGSPGVPMPVGQPSELRKATAARRRRQKENYAKTHESESSSGVKPRSNLDEPREHSMRCGGVLCR